MIKLISIPSSQKPEVEEIVLLCGKEYSVGRKQRDISLAKDTSISRNHATIQVDHPMANVTNASLTPSLVITDLGSKFGSFINDGIEANRTVSMREPNTLTHGDRFRFGLGPNVFKIHYTPLVVTSSSLKAVAPLKKNICALGGHLIPEWTDKCDFLVMDNLTLTVKVVCALLSAKHIVTPQYFEDYHEAVKNKTTKLPSAEDYMPELAETSLPGDLSFSPDPRRSTLFRGKTFLFVSTRQSKKIGVAIKCGGGDIDLIPNVSHITLKSPDTIIVAAQDETIAGGPCANAVDSYEKTKKRVIQESEIGLAAVYVNIEKHCNPYFSFSRRTTFPHIASQTQQTPLSNEVFTEYTPVRDSQSQSSQLLILNRTIITQSQDISRVDESTAGSAPKRTGPKVPPVHDSESQAQPVIMNRTIITQSQDISRVDESVAASPLKRPRPEETEARPAKVKRENDDDDEDDDETSAPAEKTGLSAEASTSASNNKRRLNAAEVQNAEPDAKKVRLFDSDIDIKPVIVVFKKLFARRNIIPQLNKAGDNTVRNFKTFKKVNPLAATNTNSVISNAAGKRTTNTNRTRSTITFRPVTCPTEPLVVEVNVQQAEADDGDIPDFSFD